LIDCFLQSVTNTRTDQYGGCPENRIRFLKEIVDAILESGAYPANRIGVRLSPNGNFGGMGSEDNDTMFPYVARELVPYGLAYLHVMDGLGFGFHSKCRAVTVHDMKMNFKDYHLQRWTDQGQRGGYGPIGGGRPGVLRTAVH
jgi:N-ethylmaleimide reductase